MKFQQNRAPGTVPIADDGKQSHPLLRTDDISAAVVAAAAASDSVIVMMTMLNRC